MKAVDEKKWKQAWKRISNSMRKYNLNTDVADLIDKAISIGLAGMNELAQIKNTLFSNQNMSYADYCVWEREQVDLWEKKYNCLNSESVLSFHTQNYWANKMPTLGRMKFPAEEISRAIERVNGPYSPPQSYHRCGQKRDWTYDFRRKVNGTIAATYASEFSGCGNGSYYMIISPTQTMYCEDD